MMSRLLIVTRPQLVPGFELAGVEAFGADDANEAQRLIEPWLERGETGLLAIDAQLLSDFTPAFVKRLTAAENLYHMAIPGSEPLAAQSSRREQVADMIREAIGFHITFRGSNGEGTAS